MTLKHIKAKAAWRSAEQSLLSWTQSQRAEASVAARITRPTTKPLAAINAPGSDLCP